MLPLVSCICPTYNRMATRPHLLEEAVESFLRQDYRNKELIIINDHPLQNLIYYGTNIRIINYHERFKTLGEKYNYGISLSYGTHICSWEDDDISLPNRISTSLAKIGTSSYFNPKSYYFSSGDIFQKDGGGYSHNCSMFTKDAWSQVGGYPLTSGPQDAQMDGLLRGLNNTIEGGLTQEECFYIYRWGVSNLHLSGYHDTQQVYDDYALQASEAGTYVINPHWDIDYVEKVQKFLKDYENDYFSNGTT